MVEIVDNCIKNVQFHGLKTIMTNDNLSKKGQIKEIAQLVLENPISSGYLSKLLGELILLDSSKHVSTFHCEKDSRSQWDDEIINKLAEDFAEYFYMIEKYTREYIIYNSIIYDGIICSGTKNEIIQDSNINEKIVKKA